MRRNIGSVVFVLAVSILLGFLRCSSDDIVIPENLEPYVVIDRPPPTGGLQALPEEIIFEWHSGIDEDPQAVRHLWSLVVDTNGIYKPTFDIIGDLNENPERYEGKWTPWIPYDAANDSGRTTVIGDDEQLEMSRDHIFAVQAINRFGRVTETFESDVNVREFKVVHDALPVLFIAEPSLGFFKFHGTKMSPVCCELPPGIPLSLLWRADASTYAGSIATYRYGWDIVNMNDPDDWDVPPGPEHTSAPEITYYSGTHTLTVETVDFLGSITLGFVQITLIPFTMERNLLWVDDFYSIDFNQILWATPTESQHDQFWTGICGRAAGWEESRDVYDCTAHAFLPPDMNVISMYKNIIWTYSNERNCWSDVVLFTPESFIGMLNEPHINLLSIFLMKGGHLWTLGRADRHGGLSDILHEFAQSYPMSLRCEIMGNRSDCAGDTSGVHSMGYKDYCVTMIDKIIGIFRTDPGMPLRQVKQYDAMKHAYKDNSDVVTAMYADLPERLDLWDQVTRPGRYFDPDSDIYPGGFTYAELYDPAYWMNARHETSQHCFHPLYRMRSVNSLSAVDHATVAVWITKYEDIVPDVASGIAVPARSLHFGFPLWFFNRAHADSIVDVVFDEWQISDNP